MVKLLHAWSRQLCVDAVVKGGAIVEQGFHAHLLQHHPEGAYATLLKLQLMAQEADKADALLDSANDDAIPAHALQQLQVHSCATAADGSTY